MCAREVRRCGFPRFLKTETRRLLTPYRYRTGTVHRNIMKLPLCACYLTRRRHGVIGNSRDWLASRITSSSRSAALPLNEMVRSRGLSTTKGGPSGTKPSNEELVNRMRHRFHGKDSLLSQTVDQQHNAWDSLWKDGTTPWNLGKPTPALISELETHWTKKISSPTTTSPAVSQFRTLVPGCGAGYDLVTLARHHEKWIQSQETAAFDHRQGSVVVVGLDVSETSLKRASTVIESAFQDCAATQTRVDLVQGDFFGKESSSSKASPWTVLHSCGYANNETSTTSGSAHTNEFHLEHFDFIFDYTFFCALPPSLRPAWGARIAELLTPGTGLLLTFIYPIQETASGDDEGDSIQGPPYPVTVDGYRRVLELHGVFMEEDGGGPRENPDTVPARSGRELVCWWRKRQKVDRSNL
jgi:methyl halide transferase